MSKAPYYPVFLDLAGRSCLVIGGGSVARRKVETLLEYETKVKVISPVLSPELEKMAAEGVIEAIARRYQNGDLVGAFLVIAATDNTEINEQVCIEAKGRGQLINVVDDAGRSNFIVPSSLRRGDITIAISTSGMSPALARKIRVNLEERIGPEYGILARLVNEVRSQLIDSGQSVSPERWQQALDIDHLIALLKVSKDAAKTALLRKLKED